MSVRIVFRLKRVAMSLGSMITKARRDAGFSIDDLSDATKQINSLIVVAKRMLVAIFEILQRNSILMHNHF